MTTPTAAFSPSHSHFVNKENQLPEEQAFSQSKTLCNYNPVSFCSNYSPGSPRRDLAKPTQTSRSLLGFSHSQQTVPNNGSHLDSIACVDVTKMNRAELEAWCQMLTTKLIECSLDVDEWKARARSVTEQGKELYNMYLVRCRQLQHLSKQLQQVRTNALFPGSDNESNENIRENNEWPEKYRTLCRQFEAVAQECQNMKKQFVSVQQEHAREVCALRAQLETYRTSVSSQCAQSEIPSKDAASCTEHRPERQNLQDDYKERYIATVQDKQALEQRITRIHALALRNVALSSLSQQLYHHITRTAQLLQGKSDRLHHIRVQLLASLHDFTTRLSCLTSALSQLATAFQSQCKLTATLQYQLQQQMSDVATLRYQLQTRTAETQVLNLHYTELQAEVVTEHALRRALEEQLNDTERALRNLQKTHLTLQQYVSFLQQSLQQQQQQLNDITSSKIQLEEAMTLVEKERDAERTRRSEAEEKLQERTRDVACLSTQLHTLTESQQASARTLNTIQRELQVLTESYRQLELEKNALARNAALEQQQVQILQRKYDEVCASQHTLERELGHNEWALSISHGHNIMMETQLRRQEMHSYELQNAVTSKQSEVQHLQHELGALRTQFTSTQEELAHSQHALTFAHERIASLTSELDSVSQRYDSLTAKYQQLCTEHNTAIEENTLFAGHLARLHGVQYQLEQVQRELEMAQHKYHAAEKELDVLRASHATLREELHSLQTQYTALQMDRATLDAQLCVAQKDLISLQQREQQVTERNTQLEARVNTLLSDVQTRDAQLQELSQILAVKDAALQENATRLEAVNNQLRDLQTRCSTLAAEHDELTHAHLSAQTQIQLLTVTKNDLTHTISVLEQQIKQVEEVWQNRIVNLQHHLHSRSAQERARLEEYKLLASHRQEELSLLQTQYRTLLNKNKLLQAMCNTLLLQLDYTYRALTKTLFSALKIDAQSGTTNECHDNNNNNLSQQSSRCENSKLTVGERMVTVLKKATTWLAQRRQLLELNHNYRSAQAEVEHLRNELDKQQRKAVEMEDHYEELLRAVRLELWKAKEQWDVADEYCRMFSSLFRQIQSILQQEQQNSSNEESSNSNSQQSSQTQQLVQKLLCLINYHFIDIQTS